MIRLRRAPNIMIGQHWVNLLTQARIPCHLNHHYLQGALGEMPVDQCGSEVWLEREADRAMALRILDEDRPDPLAPQSHWYCDACNEWLEPQFTICWGCGAERT